MAPLADRLAPLLRPLTPPRPTVALASVPQTVVPVAPTTYAFYLERLGASFAGETCCAPSHVIGRILGRARGC